MNLSPSRGLRGGFFRLPTVHNLALSSQSGILRPARRRRHSSAVLLRFFPVHLPFIHPMNTSQSESDLKLPPYDAIILRAEIDYYGASGVLSRHCGVDLTDKPLESVAWGHGWIPDFRIHSDPRLVTGQSLLDKNQKILTSKVPIEAYLKDCGYPNTHAIGLPVIYLKAKKIDRLKNSLLVMPAHSLEYTRHDSWKFAEYVSEIEAVSKDFDDVYVCVHSSCLKHGYWVKEFQSRNFKIIQGLNIYDKNALYRLQQLMSTFEYVTTNSFGSHIAYGAYFGAKVSIYGTYTEYKEEDFETDPFYTLHKDVLKLSLEIHSKQRIEKELPSFFTSPIDAPVRTDWGEYEVGACNKKSPREIRELLDLRDKTSMARNCRELIARIRAKSVFRPKN
jgi:hypothetical protein